METLGLYVYFGCFIIAFAIYSGLGKIAKAIKNKNIKITAEYEKPYNQSLNLTSRSKDDLSAS